MLEAVKAVAVAEQAVAAEIQKAAQNSQWDEVAKLTVMARRLTQIKLEMQGAPAKAGPSHGFIIEVTSGAVANSYLSATAGIKGGLLKVGQPVTLVLGDKEIPTTVLKYGRFQDRKHVAAFYDDQKIQPGDQLQLISQGGNEWHVEKVTK